MPEHLRALITILFLATLVFAFARRPASDLISNADFTRRRNLWLGLTLLAFLSHNYWIYALFGGIWLAFAASREHNRLSLFFFLLFLVPAVPVIVRGFGLVNYLFLLNHIRLLELVILLPAAIYLLRKRDTLPFGRVWPDRLLAGYLALSVALQFRDAGLTEVIRETFYFFIDILLPYYVASRWLTTLQGFKDAMLAFVLAAMLLAIIGVFEFSRHWLLYKAVVDTWNIEWSFSTYLGRGGLLRASASTGQAIILGYIIVVAIGFYLFLQDGIRSKLHRRLGGLLLLAGLVAPLSRGPWVGAVVLIVVFIATGRQALQRLILLGIVATASLPLLAVLPGGSKVLDFLPYFGTLEKSNIDYREQLLQSAWIVIQRNPWFGSVNYLETPEMMELRQGDTTMVDVVNSYLQVALSSGGVGLGLFIGFFILTGLAIRKAMKSLPDKEEATYLLGRALLASLLAIMVTIVTVSSIGFISTINWCLTGMGVAYAQMIRKQLTVGN